MKVAMMQPAFMPWQGFFELVYKSDRFILLDDFQFSVQSYHQRNRLFVNPGQVDWYSVPVQKAVSFKAALNQTKINETMSWRKKMWKRIQQNYAKTPYFAEIAPRIEPWLLNQAESLAAQNIVFIKLVAELMGFKRDFRLSSQTVASAKSSQRVLDLLRQNEADHYFCAQGSFGYMREEKVFPVKDIKVLFQDFVPQTYRQNGSSEEFVPSLSVLDALMNVGPEATAKFIKSGTKKWLTWEEMIKA